MEENAVKPKKKQKTLDAGVSHRIYLSPLFSCHYVATESDRVKSLTRPDHIPDYHWAEPGQADPGKTTAEWRQHFSGVLWSVGPGQRRCERVPVLRRASLPGSVCLCVRWLWWPTQSSEDRQQVCSGRAMLAKQRPQERQRVLMDVLVVSGLCGLQCFPVDVW